MCPSKNVNPHQRSRQLENTKPTRPPKSELLHDEHAHPCPQSKWNPFSFSFGRKRPYIVGESRRVPAASRTMYKLEAPRAGPRHTATRRTQRHNSEGAQQATSRTAGCRELPTSQNAQVCHPTLSVKPPVPFFLGKMPMGGSGEKLTKRLVAALEAKMERMQKQSASIKRKHEHPTEE